jgi:hypothetical protein
MIVPTVAEAAADFLESECVDEAREIPVTKPAVMS